MRGTALVIVLILVGCYDQPTRNCPFSCGGAGECPSGFECAADNLCHEVQPGGGLLPCEAVLPDSALVSDGPAADGAADASGDGEPSDAELPDAGAADARPADARPADARPADARPADARPADARPPDAMPGVDAVIATDAIATRRP